MSLKPEIGQPMERNASALMLSTMAGAALGLAFWLVAARTYRPADVGRASAEISAMTLLASLSQLNLINVFPRFLPNAGHRTKRVVVAGYSAAIAVAFVVATCFVLAGAGDAYLVHRFAPALIFVGSVVCWTIFTIQDAALTGLRGTVWIPVENISFSVAKIGLLFIFGVLIPASGIFAAWMLPVVCASIPVNVYLFRRLVPREIARSDGRSNLPSRRAIGMFVAGEYVGSVAQNATTMLLPLIVVARLGAAATAYFYTSWIVAVSFDQLLSNIAVSFIVEGSSQPSHAKLLARRAAGLSTAVVIPGVVVVVATAPFLLGMLGHGYAVHGTLLLRLVAISMPFRAIVVMFLALARLVRRVRRLVLIQLLDATMVVGLTIPLLGHFGIAGAGLAYLGTHILLGIILLPSVLRQYRLLGSWRPRPEGSADLPDAVHAVGCSPLTGSGRAIGRAV